MIDTHFSFAQELASLAERARALRIRRGLHQDQLAERAGLGVATIVRFEKSGRASIENVLRIAVALDAEQGFARLFEQPAFATLDEAIGATAPEQKKRRRAR